MNVLSTDDPVRVFQQFATADAVSGGGRMEITAGRGSSAESYPPFGYERQDYDRLFAEKLDLLMTVNNARDDGARVSWAGTVRPALQNLAVVPRPVRGQLPIWLGTGGSAPSSARAGKLGLPVSYGIIGGTPARFAPLAKLYRSSAVQAGHSGGNIKVSVGTFGLIAPTKKEAMERFYPGWHNLNTEMVKLRGWPAPEKSHDALVQAPRAYYVGGPDEIAERIADLHRHLGHTPLPANGHRRPAPRTPARVHHPARNGSQTTPHPPPK